VCAPAAGLALWGGFVASSVLAQRAGDLETSVVRLVAGSLLGAVLGATGLLTMALEP